MALSYKIRTFDTASGSILISVHNAGGTEVGAVNIDLPMDSDGLYLVGDALTAYITGFIPEGHFTRLDTVGGGVANASAITALLEAYPAVEVTEEEAADIAAGTNQAIDARLTHHSLI
tara:strand:- start:571 stop:924 length:354 start_codon:yes stop_codon:yes gene_type:complete